MEGELELESKQGCSCATTARCRHFVGAPLLPFVIFGGLLAGVLSVEATGRRSSAEMARRVESIRPQLIQWETLCDDLGERPSDVGVAWLLHQPAVTSPIVGPRTIAQLDGAIHATSIHLSSDVLDRIDAIFPGPGPAPEAYAW